jgi:bifunctional non-homologous end joining protein LigD
MLTARAQKRQPVMPARIAPMMATSIDRLPVPEDQYAYEWKWDGVRAIAFWDGKCLRLQSRNLLDITLAYPELHAIGKVLGKKNAVLDGEIIALDSDDRPSFKLLQQRMHVRDVSVIQALSKRIPVWFVLFDLLYLKDRLLVEEPYTERRRLLESLKLIGPNWQISTAYRAQGAEMLDTARHQRLEGIVAKRLDSAYEIGRRSKSWLKIKVIQRQEFVVGGWIPERSGNARRVGAMLIGYHDEHGDLRYAGKIGTGLSGPDHELLLRRFASKRAESSPFVDLPRMTAVTFLKPILVIEVEYRRWPTGGMVQQGAYKGIREDKPARKVVRELAGK